MSRFTGFAGMSLRAPSSLLVCTAGLLLGLNGAPALAQVGPSSSSTPAAAMPASQAGVGATNAAGNEANDDVDPAGATGAGTVAGTTGDTNVTMTDSRFAERAKTLDARQRVLDDRTTQNNYVYAVAQHNCYSRFFVNACLSKARDKMRDEKTQIRDAQLALSAERRSDRQRNREYDDALKQQRATAQAPARRANEKEHRANYEAKQQQHEIDMAKRGQDAGQRAANVAAYNQKQAAHQQALDQARRDAAADAAKRASNVQRYQDKQTAAAQRRQALDDRRAQARARAARSADASSPSAASAAAGGKQ